MIHKTPEVDYSQIPPQNRHHHHVTEGDYALHHGG